MSWSSPSSSPGHSTHLLTHAPSRHPTSYLSITLSIHFPITPGTHHPFFSSALLSHNPLIHPRNHFLISSHIPPPPPSHSLIHPSTPSLHPFIHPFLPSSPHASHHPFVLCQFFHPPIHPPHPLIHPLSVCPSIYSLTLPFPVHSSIHLSSIRPFTPRAPIYSTANLHDEETLTFSLKYSDSVPS